MPNERQEVWKQYDCGCRDVLSVSYDRQGVIDRGLSFVPCEIHDYDNSPPLHVVMDAVLYNEATKEK